MKNIDVAYLSKKINQLNKKIHRAKKQGNEKVNRKSLDNFKFKDLAG